MSGSGALEEQAAQASPGFVLCLNYMFLDESMLGFWNGLHRELQERGLHLFMLSTTPVSGADFSVLELPYHFSGFAGWPDNRTVPWSEWAHDLASTATAWDPHAPAELRERGAEIATSFHAEMLAMLQPSVVLAWNAMHPQSQLLMGLARLAGIPAYSVERGWLRDTVMFDLGENSLLTEWNVSISLRSVLREARGVDRGLWQRWREHCLGARVGRYAQGEALSPLEARHKLGLREGEPVLVAFTHAEPGVYGRSGSVRDAVHQGNSESLDEWLSGLASAASERGLRLLVQEHPINQATGVKRPRAAAAGATWVSENIHTLLGLADVTFHTGSTVQIEALFYEKPVVLLGRGMLSMARAPGAYSLAEFGHPGACLDAALDAEDWPHRLDHLRTLVACMAQHQLVDLGRGIVPRQVRDVSDLFAEFYRPAPADLERRIEGFLARWSLDAGAGN